MCLRLSMAAAILLAVQQADAATVATFTSGNLKIDMSGLTANAIVTVDSGFVKVNGADPLVSGTPTPVATSAVTTIDVTDIGSGNNTVDLSAVNLANGFPVSSPSNEIYTYGGDDNIIGTEFGDLISFGSGSNTANAGGGFDWYFITDDFVTSTIDEPEDNIRDFVSFQYFTGMSARNYTVTNSAGFIRFTGTSPAGTLDIKGAPVVLFDGTEHNDVLTIQGPLSHAELPSFTLSGLAGDDTFTVTGTQDFFAQAKVINGATPPGNDTYTFLEKSLSTLEYAGTMGPDTISATDGPVLTMSIAGTTTGTATVTPVEFVAINTVDGSDNITFPPLTTTTANTLYVYPGNGDDVVDLRGIGGTIPQTEVYTYEGDGSDSFFADTNNARLTYRNYCDPAAGTEPPTYSIGADGTRMALSRTGGSWGFSSTGFRHFIVEAHNTGSSARATYNFATLPADAPTGTLSFWGDYSPNEITVNTPMGSRPLYMIGHIGSHDILNVDVLGAVWTLDGDSIEAPPSAQLSHSRWEEVNIVNGPAARVGDWMEY